jgi:hypothetical protein
VASSGLNQNKTMKTKSIATIVLLALLPIASFAQPPAPPAPPVPPAGPANPLIPPEPGDKRPKVPVTFLGVETSHIPSVVCEQLGLAKGFGLVIDYVSPDGPAAAAGVKENDILKMLNDQILTEPDQLSKLIRSYPEGTAVTLTVLRKGQEQKISVKLGKREVSEHRHGMMGPDFHGRDFGDIDFGDLNEGLRDLKDQIGDEKQGMIHNAVMQAQEAAQRAREEGQRAREQAQRISERVREQAERIREKVKQSAAGQIQITRSDDGVLKTTRIDLHKAQIAYSDDKGEMNIAVADGKKVLTAKDPQGKLLFSGPVETKEDLDKLPADVRQRYDKLEQKDLPEIVPSTVDQTSAADDMDSDDDADDDSDSAASETMQQVSNCSFPHLAWPMSSTVLI